MNAEPYFMRMPAKDIDVVEPGRRARKDHIAFDLGRDVSFSTAALESFGFARWEPVTHDALVVAAAVEYADKIVKCPPHGWGRRLTLRIPVHDPARWSAPDVSSALHDALGFLTGDVWAISFVKRTMPEPALSLGMLALTVPTQAILAFSNGMDSRAVAGLVGATLGEKLVRVRVGTMTADRPREKGKREPFTAVPYDVSSDMPNRETSARTRGFKFALISGIAAYLTDAIEIVIPESGQGAVGPALLTVGHAYPDFRNHPCFTRRMERFLKALLDKDVSYVFPPHLEHQRRDAARVCGDRQYRHLAQDEILLAQQPVEFDQREAAAMRRLCRLHATTRQRSRRWPDRAARNVHLFRHDGSHAGCRR